MRKSVAVTSACAVVIMACGGSDGTPLLDGGGGEDSATNDAGTSDASSSPDVSTSDVTTGDAGDAASCPSFCGAQSGALFCSDFDGESTPADWSKTVVSQNGTVTIASQDVSCPNGLTVTLPMISNPSTAAADAKVTKDIATINDATHVVLDLEAYLPSNDTKSYVVFFGVRPTAEAKGGIFVTHHGDAFWFLSNGNGMNVAINPAPLTGAWNAMKLDVVFGASNAAIVLSYTGADNAQHMINASGMTAAAPVVSVTVETGMEAPYGTEAAFSASYDNVVLATSK